MTVTGLTGLSRLRRFNGVALLAFAVVELVYGVSSLQWVKLLRAAASPDLSDIELEYMLGSFQRMDDLLMSIYSIAGLTCAILGATWVYGAVRNAGLLQPGQPRISPLMAVGWHLVPIAFLFMPYIAMRQTFNSSVRPARPLTDPAPLVLRLWWAGWLLTSGLGLVVLYTSLADVAPWAQMAGALLDTANSVFLVVVAYLWWRVISLITDLQDSAGRAAPVNPHPERREHA